MGPTRAPPPAPGSLGSAFARCATGAARPCPRGRRARARRRAFARRSRPGRRRAPSPARLSSARPLDLLDRTAALHRLGLGADGVAPCVRLPVALFHEQPALLLTARDAAQRPAAFELVPLEQERCVLVLELVLQRALAQVAVLALVPDDDFAGT